jgi:steroid delta-isomerase-like uncharacterized protein
MNIQEANKTVVRRYIEEVINGGRLELIDTFFAPHMRGKVRQFLSGGDDPFPDGREELQDLVAEGDTVIARWTFRGTHRGLFLGVPATGKSIEILGFAVYYFKDGQIHDDLMVMEWLDALEQMGARIVPPSGAETPNP